MNELTITHGNQQVVLRPGQVAHIGRREGSALVVGDPRVSREHLQLSWRPQGWLLENLGRAGTFVFGQPVTQFFLAQPVEVQLAAVDGPAVRFEPNAPAARQATAMREAAAPGPAATGPGTPEADAYPAGTAYPGATTQAPPMPGAFAQPSVARGRASGTDATGALQILIPIRAWLTDPALRQWPKLAIAAYALLPVIAAVVLQNSTLTTIGWVYCLYIAPLWALVFWWLIRPGPIGKMHAGIAAVIIAAEYILVPVLTRPWEKALEPPNGSHNLFAWIYGVGLAEEITKALPVLVLATFLLKAHNTRLDVRMWMFLATLSGLFFGVYEASTVYVPQGLDILSLFERVFVDGLQHALWAGVAGFFIGLGTNYRRQRFPLWFLGIAIPAVLHGLNDWSLNSIFGSNGWPWVFIQAFSVFLFLGYASSAHAIEREVRQTPIFRGESMILDLSRPQTPWGRGLNPAS